MSASSVSSVEHSDVFNLSRFNDSALEAAELEADLLTLDLNSISCGYVPEDFIGTFLIRNEGEFCLTTDAAGYYRLSLFSMGKVHHFPIKESPAGFHLAHFKELQLSTVGELLIELRNANPALLGSMAACTSLHNLVTLDNFYHNTVIASQDIYNKKYLTIQNGHKIYTGVALVGNVYVAVHMKEAVDGSVASQDVLYEEYRSSMVTASMDLPVCGAIAIALTTPRMLIYNRPVGMTLPAFLEHQGSTLTVNQKLDLSMSLVDVVCSLLDTGLFLPAVKLSDFKITIDHHKWKYIAEIQSNEKLAVGREVDFSIANATQLANMAPEVAYTRKFTEMTEVFHMGKIVQKIFHCNKNDGLSLEAAKYLSECLSRSLDADLRRRPTMDGLYLLLRDVKLINKED